MKTLRPIPHDYLPAAGRDSLLPLYDLLAKFARAGRIYGRLIDQADLADGQKVLEIGCGTGNLAALAVRSEPGIDMVAVDPDPLALRRARRKAAEVSFDQSYAQRLDHPDATFDRALSSLMLHHIADDEKPSVLAELYRVIRPGGSVHIVDIIEHGHRMSWHGMPQAGPSDNVVELLTEAGFDSARSCGTQRTPLGTVEFFSAKR